ncbi:hypothetical protein [Microbispora sp. H10949]|uniref:hypothetical protein n=1 Tax=Microbispora sp. H10949 TaxID=2729111 RepID=UPI0016006542|nr:hypothetical protein [Microbispora sp. H10949]
MTEEAAPPVVEPVASATAPATVADPAAGPVEDERLYLAEVFGLAKKLDGTWPLFARSLDPATDPARLRGRYRSAAVSTARWSIRRRNVDGYVSLLALLLMFAVACTVLVTVFSVDSWQELRRAAGGLVVFFVIAWWSENRRHRPLFRLIDSLVSVVGLGCFPVALYGRYASGPAWAVGLAGEWWMPIVQSIGVFCVGLVLAWAPVQGAMRLWDRESPTFPTEPLFEHLTTILTRMEPDHRGRLPPKARQEILTLLAKVAVLLRAGIPAAARGGTSLTRAVVRARAIEASKAVVDLQLWIALPSPTAYDDFRTQIADLTRTILTGEYDRLPTRETTPEATRRTWHARAVETTRTLIIALVPLAVLLAVHRLGLTLPSPFDDGALIAALAWAVVLLLGLLDPNFPTHLAAVRDLTSLNPFTEKNPGRRLSP